MYEIMEICMAVFKGGQPEWGFPRNHVAVRMPSCLGFHRGWLVASFGDRSQCGPGDFHMSLSMDIWDKYQQLAQLPNRRLGNRFYAIPLN
jgi:hypothetical protein